MSIVVCEASKLLTLTKHSQKCPSLRIIVTMADSVGEEEREVATKTGVRIYTMAEVKVRVGMTLG